MQSSRAFDYGLCFFALLLMLASSYLLINDISLLKLNYQPVMDRKQVAKIVDFQHSVRMKSAFVPFWESLRSKGQQVYERDSLFTDANSSAVIEFLDGNRTEIGENSLIVFDVRGDRVQLQLKRGELAGEIATSRNIDISVGESNTRVEARNARVRIGVDESGKTDISVLEGSVQVQSASGVSEIGANQRGVLGADGQVGEIQEIKIQLQSPQNRAIYYQKPTDRLEMRWNSKLEGAEYIVEFSDHPRFNRVIRDVKTPRSGIRVPLRGDGVYYWRVKALDPATEKLETSEIHQLTLRPLSPPRLMTPPSGRTINHPDAENIQPVLFGWEGIEGLAGYQIQVATDHEFENVIVNRAQATHSLTVPNLSFGDYFWRVRSLASEDQPSEWSELRRLSIQETPLPSQVESIGPEANEVFVIHSPESAIEFSWAEDANARRYQLEISPRADFAHHFVREQTESTGFSWKPNRIGQAYWRVRGVDAHGRQTQTSETRRFVMVPGKPVLVEPPHQVSVYTDAKDPRYFSFPLRFSWQTPPFAEGIHLDISKDPGFTEIITSREVENRPIAIGHLPQGNYYWRIRSSIPGTDQSLPSDPFYFEVHDLPPLEAPNVRLHFRSMPQQR